MSITGCGQLLGLDDFHEAQNGGASGAGATAGVSGTSGGGSGGTAATGGTGATGGTATGGTGATGGTATGGTGGQPSYVCSPQSQAFHLFVPADLPGIELEAIRVFSAGSDEFYVALSGKDGSQAVTTWIRHFGNTGNAKHTHTLTGTQEVFLPSAIAHSGGQVTMYGHDEALVSLSFPDSNDEPPTRTVLANPCLLRRSFFVDSDPSKYLFQCANGDIYTDESSTIPATSSPHTLLSGTYANGTYFISLLDENDSNDVTQVAHSPSWTPLSIDVDAAHREQTFLYPARVPGEVLAVTAAYSSTEMSYFTNSFPAVSPPSSSAAIIGNQVIGPSPLSQVFVPGRGKPKLNVLSWASYELGGGGVFLSRFNTDGTPQGWRQPVATESTGTVVDSYAATLSSLWSVAVWLVEVPTDGGVEYRGEGRVMACVSQ